VRDMRASNSGSEIMLKVLALAVQRNVPVETKRRVGREVGYGANAYADIVVSKMRTDSRGFESSR
jgi:hypothetical protein